jgi:hypothetical protein
VTQIFCGLSISIRLAKERLNAEQSIFTYRIASPIPHVVSDRDCCVLSTTKRQCTNGSISMGFCSVPRADNPRVKGTIRMTVHMAGFQINPVPGNSSVCEVTYVMQVDPMGGIPKWIYHYAAARQPLCIAHIRRLLEAKSFRVSENCPSVSAIDTVTAVTY